MAIFMLNVHARAAIPCTCSMFLSMLHVHFSMLHVHAVSILHAHAAIPLHFHAANPLHVHAACYPYIILKNVFKIHQNQNSR
jgi:hypothetical protein